MLSFALRQMIRLLGAHAFLSCSAFAASPLELVVTRRDDDVRRPRQGMLRWALQQKEPRRVTFAVSGDIRLEGAISVKHGDLVLDGSTAPNAGVCIRGGSLEFMGARYITLRYLRVRLGDETVLRALRRSGLKRPAGSEGLDCVALRECQDVLMQHCSLSWSCDELLSVVRCQRVRVQDCILSEPLGHPRLHPYGDHHAYAVLASASTLRIERCLLAHYQMRGPQFEANDLRRADKRSVEMSAVDNVMFGYWKSGSRYTTGPEDHKQEARGARFTFTFQDNLYLPAPGAQESIEKVTKHGSHPGVRLVTKGNRVLVAGEKVETPWLATVGCSHKRDAVDTRILEELAAGRIRKPLASQREVGGWPSLTSGRALWGRSR
jgi:hypothetical protein